MAIEHPIVLTGAASGIGDATARRLIDRGHSVISLDIKEPSAAVAAHHPCDMRDPASIRHAVDTLPGPYGSLLNVAGVPGTVGAEQTMRVNLFGLRMLTECLWNRICDGGTVVNVASVAGNNWRKRRPLLADLLTTEDFEAALRWWSTHEPDVDTDPYTFSKEGVVFYTMLLAGRGARRGIRVNDVGPGPVDTPILPDFTTQVGAEQMRELIERIGRPASPVDIAEAIVVLAEGEMRWVNGQHLVVDGGLSASFSTGVAPDRDP